MVSLSASSISFADIKLTGFIFSTITLIVGLWIIVWTVPPLAPKVSSVPALFGLALVGFAAAEISYTLQGHLTEIYTMYACSALSGLACMRALVRGAMVLLWTQMFEGLGNNVALSVLAGLRMVLVGAPFIFFRYGPLLRKRSPYAIAKSL